MSKEQLQKEKSALEVQYAEIKAKNLKLDIVPAANPVQINWICRWRF